MEPFSFEVSSATSSLVVTPDSLGLRFPDVDLLLHVKSNHQIKSFNVTATPTQLVRDGFNAYFARCSEDISMLCSVIFWQKKTIDFQALHTALLLNSVSEDEFQKEAEKFIVHQKDVPPEVVASVVERIDSLIGFKFDTSDYADYFQCTQENVVAGLRLLPHPDFAEMLPAPNTEDTRS